MPAVAGFVPADWSITRATGVIDYIGDDHGGADPSYATVLEFHRAISDFADNATSSGDDQHDITDPDATDRSTDNIVTVLAGYTITDAAAEHIYDGSIIQNDDDSIWDGIVNVLLTQRIQLIQNGAVLADDWWNSDPFGNGFGLNSDPSSNISHRFMIKVRNAGTDIDGRRLIGTSRRFNFTPAEFSINGTARGNNVLALSESADLNNPNTAADVSGWAITNTEGLNLLDVDGDGNDEPYYSAWDDTNPAGTNRAGTIRDIYEYSKWLTRDGSAETVYGLPGELFRGITTAIPYDNESGGPFTEPEPLSWPGGTGQLLAIDDQGTTGTIWMQLLTGVNPTDNTTITGGTSGATCQVNGSVTTYVPSPSFLGQSTGANIVGGFGVGFVIAALNNQDQVFDLTEAQRVPPNNVLVTIANLDFTLGNEDYVLVTNENAGGIDFSQLSLNTTLNTDNITSVEVTTAIPTDTPASGTIRVQDDAGRYRRLEYSSYTGSTFTISSTDGEEDFAAINATAGNNVFISYLDKPASASTEAFLGVNINRTFFVRVRNAGNDPIKPFTSTAAVANAPATVTVGRIADE